MTELTLEDAELEGNDFSEMIMDSNWEIRHAIRLVCLMRQQIKEEDDFMYEKDPNTLQGTYSATVKRGILEKLWKEAWNE